MRLMRNQPPVLLTVCYAFPASAGVFGRCRIFAFGCRVCSCLGEFECKATDFSVEFVKGGKIGELAEVVAA